MILLRPKKPNHIRGQCITLNDVHVIASYRQEAASVSRSAPGILSVTGLLIQRGPSPVEAFSQRVSLFFARL